MAAASGFGIALRLATPQGVSSDHERDQPPLQPLVGIGGKRVPGLRNFLVQPVGVRQTENLHHPASASAGGRGGGGAAGQRHWRDRKHLRRIVRQAGLPHVVKQRLRSRADRPRAPIENCAPQPRRGRWQVELAPRLGHVAQQVGMAEQDGGQEAAGLGETGAGREVGREAGRAKLGARPVQPSLAGLIDGSC